jgi:hypothetical protein
MQDILLPSEARGTSPVRMPRSGYRVASWSAWPAEPYIYSIVGAAPARENRRQGLKALHVKTIATLPDSWQKQNLFLNVGGQVEQIHDWLPR